MLVKYQEIRDGIFTLCREHGLRPDFPETTRTGRLLLLWSPDQVVVARAFIPTVADPPPTVLVRLEHDLSRVFGEGDGMSMRMTVTVTREGRYWVGVPDGYPGSCMGRSIMELMQEAQAILPFMASGADGVPVPDVVIDYTFSDVPVELSDDIHRYRELVTQRKELDRTLNELAARTVKRLRSVADLTDEDSAAMLGISRQRVNQLRNA